MSPFAAPLGLLGLLAVPVVFLLHRLRRRLRERRVAGLFLFAPDTLSAGAGRTVSPLLRTASLWLEVAAAVALGCVAQVSVDHAAVAGVDRRAAVVAAPRRDRRPAEWIQSSGVSHCPEATSAATARRTR